MKNSLKKLLDTISGIVALAVSAAFIAALILFMAALPGAAWKFLLWAWGL